MTRELFYKYILCINYITFVDFYVKTYDIL